MTPGLPSYRGERPPDPPAPTTSRLDAMLRELRVGDVFGLFLHRIDAHEYRVTVERTEAIGDATPDLVSCEMTAESARLYLARLIVTQGLIS